MKAILSEAHYFPNISYLAACTDASVLVLDDTENFQKQTYRNRCEIMGANGVLKLIVPMNHRSHRAINKIEMSPSEQWQHTHIKSIASAYGRSPFFDDYAPDLLDALQTQTTSLFELNYVIMACLIEAIGLDVTLAQKSNSNILAHQLTDRSNLILAKKPDDRTLYPAYQQVFDRDFRPNLSILDLLFNLGPETLDYLIRTKQVG